MGLFLDVFVFAVSVGHGITSLVSIARKVLVEDREPVRIVTIDRPDVHNCVDGETAVMLAEAIAAFAADEALRVLVVTGAGETAFCTGADLKNPRSLLEHDWVDRAGPMGFSKLDPGKPTIAAVNGYCFAGGMELAVWCDFRIAEAHSEFGALNRRWGVPFTDGATQRLSRICGMGNALYLIQTGVRIDAERALRLGLVQEVVEKGTALDRAMALAGRIAAYPQTSLVADRKAAIGGWGMALPEALELEASICLPAVEDPELAEGLARFVSGDRPDAPR